MSTLPLPGFEPGVGESLSEAALRNLAELPPLPSQVRYFDDFMDVHRSIRDLDRQDVWPLAHDGRTGKLDFSWAAAAYRPLLKHWIVCCLAANTDADTVEIYLGAFSKLCGKLKNRQDLIGLATAIPPHDFRSLWVSVIEPSGSALQVAAVRSFLQSLCELSVGHWMPGLRDFVSGLPSKAHDAYRVVRTGDCFIPLDQQSLIIEYLDELAARASADALLPMETLRDACILVIAFQYAFRRGQIARIKDPDVRVFNTGAVHFSAVLTKKWKARDRIKVNRRVKREWCPIFTEYKRRRSLSFPSRSDAPLGSFFGLTPEEVGFAIRRLTEHITGESWGPNDLRHTAAQRLVDSGASRLSLAEFMGHSSLRTGQVYYDTSPTQARQVNDALAVSPIYSTVAEVARTRTIDVETLLGLPEDQQIGGTPHGIPISGIGGCQVGQSNCQKNPILSCYDCRRFMPLNDPGIHRAIVEDLRDVVLEFVDAAKGEVGSPAYTQLRRTLEAAQRVADDLEAYTAGPGERHE